LITNNGKSYNVLPLLTVKLCPEEKAVFATSINANLLQPLNAPDLWLYYHLLQDERMGELEYWSI